MANYRRTVVRASALLYLAAVMIAAMSLYLPGIREEVSLIPALVIGGLGVPAAAFTYWMPWDHYHQNWFLVIGVLANLHLGTFIWATGGSQSPFWPFVVFIMLGAAAYYRDAWPLTIIVACSVAVIASPLVYERPAPLDFRALLFIHGFIVLVTFVIGRWLFHAMEVNARRALNLERSRSDFLFAVAHQLKTPLSSLHVALQALKLQRAGQSQPGSPEARLLDVATRSEERIGRHMNRLLEFFRIEAGQMELSLESISIANVIENVAEMVHPQVEAKRQRLDVQVPRACPSPPLTPSA